MVWATLAVELVARLERIRVYPYTHAGGIPTLRFPPQASPTGGESHLHPSAQKPSASQHRLPQPLRQSRRAGLQPLLDPSPYTKYIHAHRGRVLGRALKGDSGFATKMQTAEMSDERQGDDISAHQIGVTFPLNA